MQQVGGSIGTAALSTVALTATATYLAAHHAGPLAPATAAVHGYSVAFTVSAACSASARWWRHCWCRPGAGCEELRNAALAATPAPATAARVTSETLSGTLPEDNRARTAAPR